jgi:hypothetical protein
MTLQERLAAKLAASSGKSEQRVGDQCEASSRPTKASMYGPEGMFRCVKDKYHPGRHEDDYGTEWYSYPRFLVVVDHRP